MSSACVAIILPRLNSLISDREVVNVICAFGRVVTDLGKIDVRPVAVDLHIVPTLFLVPDFIRNTAVGRNGAE